MTFDGDKVLELEIKEFLSSLFLDPLCESQIFEYLQAKLHGRMYILMMKKRTKGVVITINNGSIQL